MEIKEIGNKESWEDFLLQCDEKTFLDSWNWGEFQKSMGNKIWRIGTFDGIEQTGAALVIKIAARRGTFLFVPHGPLIKNNGAKKQIIKALTEHFKYLAKTEKAIFIRIAPICAKNEENERVFEALGFRCAPTHMHPELTWELDVSGLEEQILAGMRKTTRYLIRQAQKNQDIQIAQGKEEKDIEDFYKLHQETVSRHHFAPFSLNYIKKELESFAPDDEIVVFHGKYRGELIASAIIIFWQGSAYYHHGATSMKYPKIPVAQSLQWQIIREAKKRGCRKYNFWGIAPEDKPDHPWAGLTLFKTGFSGEAKEYVKTQDLPLSLLYWPIALFESLRRKKRGL